MEIQNHLNNVEDQKSKESFTNTLINFIIPVRIFNRLQLQILQKTVKSLELKYERYEIAEIILSRSFVGRDDYVSGRKTTNVEISELRITEL